jgi:hypothetical protein
MSKVPMVVGVDGDGDADGVCADVAIEPAIPTIAKKLAVISLCFLVLVRITPSVARYLKKSRLELEP